MTHSNTRADCPPSGRVRSAGSNFPRDTQRDEPAGRYLRVLDLFSGIGGFSLGLERAGMQTVAFCEIEPYCQAVLRKHWPDVPIYSDIRTLTADALSRDGIAVDVICGGFPCQDISDAGQRAGIAGERSGLWWEFARLIGELRPRFVIVENVAALLDRGMGEVLGGLAALRYDAVWDCISAHDLGLPHERDRVFIVANPSEIEGLSSLRNTGLCPIADRVSDWTDWSTKQWPETKPRVCRVDDGVPNRSQRVEALGNSVVPQIPEIIGRAIIAAAQKEGAGITPPQEPCKQ